MSDELIERNIKILNMVLKGSSYENAGKEYKISKQRVYQIVKRLSEEVFKDHYLTISQFSRLHDLPISRVHYLIKTGGVKTEKIGHKNYIKIA